MRRNKGRLPPFVPLLKDTLKTATWKALSHGARSLYVTLKGRYNIKLQNAVYVSTRDAEEELGQYSTRRNVMRWFRELQHYGFIVMVSPAHHGVNGHGKAPHWRLTEEWYLGKAPTRDFLSWDGIPFTEKRKRDAASFNAPSFTAKNRIRGDNGVTTLVQTGLPLVPEIVSAAAEAGADGVSMSDHTGGADGVAVTSLTTPDADPNLLSAFEAMWSGPPMAIPLKGLKLKRYTCLLPSVLINEPRPLTSRLGIRSSSEACDPTGHCGFKKGKSANPSGRPRNDACSQKLSA